MQLDFVNFKKIYAIVYTMDIDNMTLDEKCEHLMNVVVDSRKRYGKMCVDLDQNASKVENKLLNLQLKTIANYRFKLNNQIPCLDTEKMSKDVEDFAQEIKENQKRVEYLKTNVRDTQQVVLQLNADRIGRRLKKPITTEAMLAAARNKNIL